MNERFEIPARLRTTSFVLIALGLLTLIIGGVVLLKGTDVEQTRFWTVLLHNSIFFLLISVASIFIQAASSLAQGGWIVAYRRVPEAIGANVWLFGTIAAAVIFLSAFVFKTHSHGFDWNPIYKWTTPVNPETGKADEVIKGKHSFLNPGMFVAFTLITIGLWSFFGRKFRSFSLAQDRAPRNSTKIYWRNITFSGLFLLVYALSQMSTTPWLWIMSIDTHWYSTMFSWYTFASAFVSGMSLILLWVVYLKNQGNLEIVTSEHIHDLGKFMFAFSIFWTYVWFAQFMLIWYGNLPEETTYFKIRQQGPYSTIWFAVFIISFIMPILVLMSRPSKRNYFTVCTMAMIIIFGHWLDFYQMIMPGTVGAQWHIDWYELGILAGFAGIMMIAVATTLSKASVVPTNHPLLKEAVVHLS